MSNGIQIQQNTITYELSDGISLDMIEIPAGSFLMGEDVLQFEKPQHQVTISPFCMGKYAITQEQWKTVASNLEKVNRDLNPDPFYFKGAQRPVDNVSWYDAVEFCDRLSQKFDRQFRLPSEAEWEYACRAGSTTKFFFGDDEKDLEKYAWYSVNSEYKTQPVGQKLPNAWGLYDMAGNCWEWCLDKWHYTYYEAPNDGSAWIENSVNENRLLRGGSWNAFTRSCSSSFRNKLYPEYGNFYYGCRVICI